MAGAIKPKGRKTLKDLYINLNALAGIVWGLLLVLGFFGVTTGLLNSLWLIPSLGVFAGLLGVALIILYYGILKRKKNSRTIYTIMLIPSILIDLLALNPLVFFDLYMIYLLWMDNQTSKEFK